MTKISLLSAALAIGMVAPVMAATTDPEVIIYRFPGVRDNGGAINTGVATTFHCTNFSGAQETIRFVTRSLAGDLLSNSFSHVEHLATVAASTHFTNAYTETANLGTGEVDGTTAIAATSINIICTAATIDASATLPTGVALRGIRFNPIPGSQE